MGSAAAPIIGGALDDKFGFRKTSDIMAIITLGLAVVFVAATFTGNFDGSPKYHTDGLEEKPLLHDLEKKDH